MKYLKTYTDRHGRQRHYIRRKGYREQPITAVVGSREFQEQYDQAIASLPPPPEPRQMTAQIPPRWDGVNQGVYFVEAAGLIKIGFSNSLKRRLIDLQIGSPVVITLLHVEPGSQVTERKLHAKFAAYRQHGEWFQRSKEIEEFIGLSERTESGSVSP